MRGWTEDTFFEILTPLLRRELAARRRQCPDVADLSVIINGEASDWLAAAFQGHIAECPECAELQKRLADFERQDNGLRENEWKNVERRFQNWSELTFATQPKGTDERENPTIVQFPEERRGWRLAWNWTWAAGLGFALLLVVTSIWLHHSLVSGLPSVAQQPARQPQPSDNHTEEAAAPGAESAGLAGQDKPAARSMATTHRVPTTAAPPQLESGRQARESQPAGNTNEDATGSVVAQSTPPDSTQQPNPLATSPSRTSLRIPNVSRPATSGSPTETRRQSTDAAAVKIPPLPASFRMESGSRLWIVLSSASQTTDGEFKFRGTLLLPAAIGNSIVLDRGTEVSGSGRNNQKETLLQLTEIHAGGVQYVLKRTAGTNAHAPGAGPAVRFDSGQVLEMWLSVESVYERQPGK